MRDGFRREEAQALATAVLTSGVMGPSPEAETLSLERAPTTDHDAVASYPQMMPHSHPDFLRLSTLVSGAGHLASKLTAQTLLFSGLSVF